MFEHPPAFLQPFLTALANLSKWFDWGALEAIGTVGALWFAVVQSGRSARLERVRVIGILTTLIGLFEPLSEAVPEFEGQPTDALQREDVFYLLRSAPELIDRAQQGLDRIPHSEIVDAGVAEWVGALQLSLTHLKQVLPKRASDKVYNFQLEGARYVHQAVGHFRDQRDFLKYGRAGTQLRRLRDRAEWRIWSWRNRRKRARPVTSSPSPPFQDADRATQPPNSKPPRP